MHTQAEKAPGSISLTGTGWLMLVTNNELERADRFQSA
jgi:hypothetical protein